METGENNPIHIQTENFNIGLASSYHLSIQLGAYHFSYCLLNTKTFTYDYIKKYPLNSKDNTATEITEIINHDSILKAEFFLFGQLVNIAKPKMCNFSNHLNNPSSESIISS